MHLHYGGALVGPGARTHPRRRDRELETPPPRPPRRASDSECWCAVAALAGHGDPEFDGAADAQRAKANQRSWRRSRTTSMSKQAPSESAVNVSSSGPDAQHPTRAQEQHVVEPGRDLVDVVGDEDSGRCRRVGGEPGKPADEVLAAARGRGPPSARRGAADPARSSAFAPTAPAAVRPTTGSRRGGRPSGRTRSDRAGHAPAARSRSVYSCHHGSSAACSAVITTSRAVIDGRNRSANDDETMPMFAAVGAHVDPPERLPEHLDRSGRRMEIQRRDPQQRGLAGAVGAEDDPTLAVADRPVDADRG